MKTKASVTKKDVSRRCFSALAVVILLFCGLMARLAYLQLMDYEELRTQVLDQYSSTLVLPASRGTIYDRNMQTLAISETVETVFISPKGIMDADAEKGDNHYRDLIADGLAELLDVDRYSVIKAAEKTHSQYEVIKKNVDEETGDKVRQFIVDNQLYTMMNLEEDSKRYYEYGNLAAHVVGFNGTDKGLAGLELYYDEYLAGTDGLIVYNKNGGGYNLSPKNDTYVPAQDGANLVTTIDVEIQGIVEKYLEKVYRDHNVQNRVAAVIMDVDTGEIYASAVYPDFDLNSPYELTGEFLAEYEAAAGTAPALAAEESGDGEEPTDSELDELYRDLLNRMWNNKVVNELYEPGSTFKIVTTAMALEESITSLSNSYDCTGWIDVDGQTIHCHKPGGHGEQSIAQTLQNSCNPAFISLGLRVGKSTFMRYFEEFGYLELTGCDMVGENKTYYYGTNNSPFNNVELATYAFGQSFKTSIIQQLRATSVVANGGHLVTPHLAKYLTDDSGNVTYTFEYESDRQVISGDIADTIVDVLYGGINTGSTKNAAVEGYSIAAKTGTSQKLDTAEEDYISSCVAFAPAEDPQVAIIVVVDEPTAGEYYGGLVAAPVVSSILSEVLPYLDIPKNGKEEHENKHIMNYTGKTTTEAIDIITEAGLEYRIIGEGSVIVDQMPKSGTRLTDSGTVILYTDHETEHAMVQVPNIKSYRAEDAIEVLQRKGLNVKVTGAYSSEISGTPWVALQDITYGTMVEVGTVITIELRYYENVDG